MDNTNHDSLILANPPWPLAAGGVDLVGATGELRFGASASVLSAFFRLLDVALVGGTVSPETGNAICDRQPTAGRQPAGTSTERTRPEGQAVLFAAADWMDLLVVLNATLLRLTSAISQATGARGPDAAKQRVDRASIGTAESSGAIGSLLRDLVERQRRIADHFDPPPPDIVGTPYVAQRLGCTTVWIADMARDGTIPEHCILPGTGNGKPWRFYRSKIDAWISSR